MVTIKQHIGFIITCTILVLCMTSCHSKRTPINRLENLTTEIQNKASDYTAEDWNAVADELEVIESEIEQYKDEYTDEELKEIGRLKGILLAQYTKASVNSITSGVENAMKEAEGLVEGLFDGFSNEASE